MRSLGHRMMAVAFAGLLACSRRAPTPAATQAATAPASTSSGGDGQLAPNDLKHGSRRLIGLDAPVFVDGVQVAVLRAGEMPPIARMELEDGRQRYRIYDYLRGIGVAPESVKSVHFHGNGDRIASVEGSELLAEKDRFLFSFLAGDTGVPLQRWDTDHLENDFVIHEIRRVTVYVKKPVPVIHGKRQCHVGDDGKCSDAIPYSDGLIAKGTRVYLDGKMVGFVKRRHVSDAMVVGGSGDGGGETRYSLAKLVSSMGVDLAKAQRVELMAGDDLVARATGAQVRGLALETSFTLPKHNHGKVRIHVPAELQARSPGVAERDALVSAVLLYSDAVRPIPRSLVAISEDTDQSVELAAVDLGRGEPGRGER